MSHLTNIVKKELKELLTPGSVISVLAMVFLFAMLGGLIGGEVEKAKVLPAIALVDDWNGEVTLPDGSQWSLYDTTVRIYSSSIPEGKSIDDYIVRLSSTTTSGGSIDREDLQSKMRDAGLTSAIIVPDTFADSIASKKQADLEQMYIYAAEGMFGSSPSMVASTVVTSLNNNLSYALLSGVVGRETKEFFRKEKEKKKAAKLARKAAK